MGPMLPLTTQNFFTASAEGPSQLCRAMHESMIRLKGAQVILYYSYIPICYNYSTGAMHSGFSYKIAKKNHEAFPPSIFEITFILNNRIVCKQVLIQTQFNCLFCLHNFFDNFQQNWPQCMGYTLSIEIRRERPRSVTKCIFVLQEALVLPSTKPGDHYAAIFKLQNTTLYSLGIKQQSCIYTYSCLQSASSPTQGIKMRK